MLIGYARVSTQDQNLDLQIDALKQVGCEQIFFDKISGSTTDRPELSKALNACESGDTLVVWRLDRLGRSLKHLVLAVSELGERGVGFKTCNDGIDTTTTTGKLIFHIFAALAEFERSVIIERTVAGLSAAKARGWKGGRPKALSSEMESTIEKLLAIGTTKKEISRILSISRSTLWRYLNSDNRS